LGFTNEAIEYELQHAAKLNNRNRGYLAEMAFMRKASAMGFGVSKPWADCECYDFVLRAGSAFWRVQVKSVRAKSVRRPHYRVTTVGRLQRPYTADQIDFLAAYIFPEDTWYIFPVSVVENRAALYLRPKSKRSHFEQYREEWKLMERAVTEPAAVSATAGS
jgi:hypothetical protein